MLAAWGVGAAVGLVGGQGSAFRAGALVLKPVDNIGQHEWLAGVLDGLGTRDDVRVVRAVPTSDGEWTCEGWSAWTYLPGETAPGRWREALATSDAFHALVKPVAWSSAASGNHPWALADEFAWGERDLDLGAASEPLVSRLLARRSHVELSTQLIHGDLAGNILYHPELPPAVIDVSPYWRPKPYADAILVADAIAWAGAPRDAVAVLDGELGRQLLLRAVLFRVAAAAIVFAGHDDRITSEAHTYGAIAAALDL